jgi:acetyltransferase-like isoleucine patch superfamily enzyme
MKPGRVRLLILIDLISASIFIPLIAIPVFCGAFYIRFLRSECPDALFLLLSPTVALVSAFFFTLSVYIVRICLPKLEEGAFDFPSSWRAKAWVIRLSLHRFVFHPAIWGFLCSFFVFRFLLLRALGAKVPYNFQAASSVAILDPQFLSVSNDVQVGANAMIASHYVDQTKLVIKFVRIGANANIYGHVLILPGAEIGENVTIGLYSQIGVDVKIGASTNIKTGCLIGSGAQIGASVKIGSRAIIGEGVKIADYAVIDTAAVIPKGSIIEAKARSL